MVIYYVKSLLITIQSNINTFLNIDIFYLCILNYGLKTRGLKYINKILILYLWIGSGISVLSFCTL